MYAFLPVIKGYCTLRELQEYYSIDDLADMVEAIEVCAEMENSSIDENMKESSNTKRIMIDGSKM